MTVLTVITTGLMSRRHLVTIYRIVLHILATRGENWCNKFGLFEKFTENGITLSIFTTLVVRKSYSCLPSLLHNSANFYYTCSKKKLLLFAKLATELGQEKTRQTPMRVCLSSLLHSLETKHVTKLASHP